MLEAGLTSFVPTHDRYTFACSFLGTHVFFLAMV